MSAQARILLVDDEAAIIENLAPFLERSGFEVRNTLLGITIKRLVGRPSPELVVSIQKIIDANLGPEYLWPGNVRELEQFVRRIFLKGKYSGDDAITDMDIEQTLINGIDQGNIDSFRLTSGYCYLLYQRHQTFEEVARRTGLDRRTVKKYIQDWKDDTLEPTS